MTTDCDIVLMRMLLAFLAVIAILGVTRILDLDDAQLRYPEPVYDPMPAYQHPPEYRP